MLYLNIIEANVLLFFRDTDGNLFRLRKYVVVLDVAWTVHCIVPIPPRHVSPWPLPDAPTGGSQEVPNQPREIISSACPGSPSRRTCLKHHPKKASRSRPGQMLELPQLAYSKRAVGLLWAPHKGLCLVEKTHFKLKLSHLGQEHLPLQLRINYQWDLFFIMFHVYYKILPSKSQYFILSLLGYALPMPMHSLWQLPSLICPYG